MTPVEMILKLFIAYLLIGFVLPACLGLALRIPMPDEGRSKRRFKDQW